MNSKTLNEDNMINLILKYLNSKKVKQLSKELLISNNIIYRYRSDKNYLRNARFETVVDIYNHALKDSKQVYAK